MAVNYTPLLQLAQPVNGTESGTWGDDVNNGISSYLDIAVAGGLAIAVTSADVTLTATQGNNLGTNISATTSQYAILNVSGAMTAARSLIVPSTSKWYIVNNNTTGGFVLTVKGAATSGVGLLNGEKALIAWNGTDFVKIASQSGAGVFTSVTDSGLTPTRVTYASTGGLLVDSANLTFDGSTLTAAGLAGPHNGTVGATTASTGAFTTLSASSTVSGTGFSTYLASPPAIGGTAAAAGSFTTLSASSTTTLSGGTANGVAYLNGSKVVTTGTALQFDGSNLGVGVTPSTSWGGSNSLKAIQISTAGGISALDAGTNNRQTLVSSNAANTGSGNKYIVSDYATLYQQGATGSHVWYNAPSGTAGNAITFTQAMTLDASGNLVIGGTTANSKLSVQNGNLALQSTTTSGNTSVGYVSGYSDVAGSNYEVGRVSFQTGNFADAGQMLFYTKVGAGALTERMRLDSSGNLGLGVTPSAWSVAGNWLQLAGNNVFGTDGTSIGSNTYYSATGWKYSNTGYANYLKLTNGQFNWLTAPSGTAGNAITFTQAMTLDSSGNLGIGTTSPLNALQIQSGAASGTGVINYNLRLSTQAAGSTAYSAVGTGIYLDSFTNNNGTQPVAAITSYLSSGGSGGAATDHSGGLALYTKSAGSATLVQAVNINPAGSMGIGTNNPTQTLTVNGGVGYNAPVTVTATTYTVAASDNWIICNNSGTSISITFPAASSYTGRIITLKNLATKNVVSASSNVVPIGSSTPGIALIAGTIGKFVTVVSDGTNWVTMTGN